MKKDLKISLWLLGGLIFVGSIIYLVAYSGDRSAVEQEWASIDSMSVLMSDYEHRLITFRDLLGKANRIVEESGYNYQVITVFDKPPFHNLIDQRVESNELSNEDRLAMLKLEVDWLKKNRIRNDEQ